MPHKHERSDRPIEVPMNRDSGVTLMTKLTHRSKYIYSLTVLALLVLSSGAGVKWV